MAHNIFDYRGRPAACYNWRPDFAFFKNGDTTVGYQCPTCCASESMDRYVYDRKKNVDGDRLIWASEARGLVERVLFVRDPLDRLEGAFKFNRYLEELPGVPQEKTIAGRLRDKPNLDDEKEFIDIILSTVQGVPEVLHDSFLPISELYKDRVTGHYVPTEHVAIANVETRLPDFPNLNTQRIAIPAFDRTYRAADLAAYYSEDLAVWDAIQ